MHRNYYYSAAEPDEVPLIPPPEKGTAPEPYGEVPAQGRAAPGEGASDGNPETGEREKSGESSLPSRRRTPPARPRRTRPPERPREKGRVRAFLLFAVLLAGLTIAGAWISRLPREPAEERFEESLPLEEPEDEELARAPVGDGTTLSFAPPDGEALPPQGIYEKVSPSVVGVRVYLKDGGSSGTGVILSENGYIITNAHVIDGAVRVEVIFSDDTREDAKLVGADEESDLAVLKVDAQDLPAAEFGDSALVKVGDTAYAIGNPLGEALKGTMTDGIISAIDREMEVEGYRMTLIQTTAAINSGNSGGALVNASGQVIGITNMKMMSSWNTIEGLGFAIPSASVKEVADQLIDLGYYAGRPALGITVQSQAASDDVPAGALVKSVEPNSDACAQGIRAGDLITAAGGQPVTSVADLEAAKEGLEVGDQLILTVWTSQGTKEVSVKLMDRHEFE